MNNKLEYCIKTNYIKCFKEEEIGNFYNSLEICNKLLIINCKKLELSKMQIIKLKYLKIICTFFINDYKNVLYLLDKFYQDHYEEINFLFLNNYKNNETNNKKIASILLRNNKISLLKYLDEDENIHKYIYGIILFSILFYYLYNPIKNYKLLYYHINIFKKWNKNFKNVLKKDFFNYYSYSLIISKLPLIKLDNMKKHNFIYILGESHILSLSWQNINIENKDHLLKPLFVPGLKAYHFSLNINHKSNIHETNILYNQLTTIPQNSIVLLIYGEIDCRLNEGISDALKKNKYNNIVECIESTINNYLQSLEIIAISKSLHLYICPVRPPFLKKSKLNKCINYEIKNNKVNIEKDFIPYPIKLVYKNALLIRDFNYMLKRNLTNYKTKNNKNWSLNYLNNVYNELCGSLYEHRGEYIGKGDGKLYMLLEKYTLEGLHLNNKVLKIIEKSINAIINIIK